MEEGQAESIEDEKTASPGTNSFSVRGFFLLITWKGGDWFCKRVVKILAVLDQGKGV